MPVTGQTTLPTWLVVVLTLGPATLTGGGAVLAAWLSGARKAAKQLDTWRRRAETLAMLRWAADKATSTDDDEALIAVQVLSALDQSKPALLQPEDQGIIDAVLDALTAEPETEVEAYPDPDDVSVEVTDG